MKKILVSGFTTFGGHEENSSQIIAKMFQQISLPEIEFRTVILPVTFSSAFEYLQVEIDCFKPDFVISLGLAGDRKKIELEKVAINLIHCNHPDNEGIIKQDERIIDSAPAAYFSTLPLVEMLKVQDIFPTDVSFSAGAYVCNYLMYRLLHYVKDTPIRAGFIHLPHLKENQKEIFDSLVSMIRSL